MVLGEDEGVGEQLDNLLVHVGAIPRAEDHDPLRPRTPLPFVHRRFVNIAKIKKIDFKVSSNSSFSSVSKNSRNLT